MDVQLPDGIKSEMGLVYDKAKIGEMTGQQQNYLMDIESLQSGLGYIDRILNDLILGFYSQDGSEYKGDKKEAIKKISISDVETLLIKIREATYGPIYYMKGACTNCGKVNDMKLDLSTLEITRSPDEVKGTNPELALPRSGKKAQLKLMTMDSMHKTFKIFRNPKAKAEIITTMAAMSLKSLDGKENPESDDLKPIPIMDINFINDEYKKLSGRIDTNITHQCKDCEQDFNNKLNVVDVNFFSLT